MSFQETLKKITLSKSDRKILGVCGGLAQGTETPSWVWRVGFVLSIFLGGIGAITYLLLWNFLPQPTGTA